MLELIVFLFIFYFLFQIIGGIIAQLFIFWAELHPPSILLPSSHPKTQHQSDE